MTKIFIAATILIISLAGTAVSQAAIPANILNSRQSLAPMLKQVMPTIVSIMVQGEIPSSKDPFHKGRHSIPGRQPIPGSNQFVALGSGVIINAKKGYIITNAHVVDEAKTISVKLNNGRQLLAKLIGSDKQHDIALLQIKSGNLTALPFADSSKVNVGDFVAAIGSPFALTQTVTAGIVSALHRSGLGIEGFENFIQTDAPINPGNSGGALVNMQGQLIGINTAILGSGGRGVAGSIGLGFAIPANTAQKVVKQLIKYGKIKRGMLGVQIQTLSPNLAQALAIPNQKGAIVTVVLPYSPAAKAGLKKGDVITAIDAETVTTSAQVRNTVGLMMENEKVTLHIIRNKSPKVVAATISNAQQAAQSLEAANPFLYGMVITNATIYSPTLGDIRGIQIVKINYGSPAFIAGLMPGDIILSANRQKTSTFSDLEKIAKESKNSMVLDILRAGGSFFIVLQPAIQAT